MISDALPISGLRGSKAADRARMRGAISRAELRESKASGQTGAGF